MQSLEVTSDRCLKQNIHPCPINRVKRLYDSCEVKLYDWIKNKSGQEVGLIAQDLVSDNLTELISIFYRDDIEAGKTQALNPLSSILTLIIIGSVRMNMIQHHLATKIDFGASGYAHYRDQTPFRAYSHLDHSDKERRHRYYLRHKVDYIEPSADFYAKKFLCAFIPIRDAKTGEDAIIDIQVGEKELVYIVEWRIEL
ncbi:putative intramolecular chaperone auto-processing domain-containing protein [Plasmopara halstedii]